MVLITIDTIVNGAYKPTNITGGAPPCRLCHHQKAAPTPKIRDLEIEHRDPSCLEDTLLQWSNTTETHTHVYKCIVTQKKMEQWFITISVGFCFSIFWGVLYTYTYIYYYILLYINMMHTQINSSLRHPTRSHPSDFISATQALNLPWQSRSFKGASATSGPMAARLSATWRNVRTSC